jgi:uncharacterized damage-inducible protein DinB
MLLQHYRKMARNNAWSNHRLLGACAQLSDADFAATRTSFFPSLRETLNHILVVDLYYLDALEEGGQGQGVLDRWRPHAAIGPLAAEQRATDRRLIAFCDALDDDDLQRIVTIDRGDEGADRETIADTLSHLFVHQIHHRGQAHAMLAGTPVPPPQLDEYFLVYDAERRAPDLATAGLEGPEAIR